MHTIYHDIIWPCILEVDLTYQYKCVPSVALGRYASSLILSDLTSRFPPSALHLPKEAFGTPWPEELRFFVGDKLSFTSVGAFCQGMLGLNNFLPTHVFSILALKVSHFVQGFADMATKASEPGGHDRNPARAGRDHQGSGQQRKWSHGVDRRLRLLTAKPCLVSGKWM